MTSLISNNRPLISTFNVNCLGQGRRRRSSHGRTTFLAENGFGRITFLADYDFFAGSFFSADHDDQRLSNNIYNLSVHRTMFCLPRGVKLGRYKKPDFETDTCANS